MQIRTLKALERDGMVRRIVRPTVPPQFEYALTDLGHSLSLPLRALGDWARVHLDEIEGTGYAMMVGTGCSTTKSNLPLFS